MKVLIVEDDAKIAAFLKKGLEEEHFLVDLCDNGEDAVYLASVNTYNVIILDIMIIGMQGDQVCQAIRAQKITTPIIMLSAKSTISDKVNLLNFGADDYISKPFNPLELMARIKSQMRRYTSLGSIAEKSNTIKIGDLELDKDAKEVKVSNEQVKLTATEYGILLLLMENAGKVFSIDEIYEKVWNELSFAPENTVSVHIRRIREKIEINPKEPKYLKVVWGIGYKIEKI